MPTYQTGKHPAQGGYMTCLSSLLVNCGAASKKNRTGHDEEQEICTQTTVLHSLLERVALTVFFNLQGLHLLDCTVNGMAVSIQNLAST